MIDLEGEELSNAVAEAYDTGAVRESKGINEAVVSIWLHADSKRCYEFACKYELAMVPSSILCIVRNANDMTGEIPATEIYTDQHSVEAAMNIAILRHLLLLKSLEKPLIIT